MSLQAYEKNIIQIANGEFSPYHSAHSAHFGAASHIIERAFAKVGVEIQFHFLPWSRGLRMAQIGNLDATFIWAYSHDRAEHFEFSPPIFEISDALMTLSDKNIYWKTLEDLKSYRIGATLGYFYGETFKSAKEQAMIQVKTANNDLESLERLFSGSVDLIIGTPEVMMIMARLKFKNNAKRLVVAGKPLQVVNHFVLFSKRSPRLKF